MLNQNGQHTAPGKGQTASRFLALLILLLVALACAAASGASSATSTPVQSSTQTPTCTAPVKVTAVSVTPGPALPAPSPVPPVLSTWGYYDIGQPVLTEIYVSPDGDDAHDGLSISSPLKTLTAAWGRIPTGVPLTGSGYRINFLPGVYPCEPGGLDDCQNYFGDRHGTYQFPVILRAYNGAGSATVQGGLDLSHSSYVYLIGLTLAGGMPLPTNQSGNNLLHLANMDHVLLRAVTLDGPDCDNDTCNNLQS